MSSPRILTAQQARELMQRVITEHGPRSMHPVDLTSWRPEFGLGHLTFTMSIVNIFGADLRVNFNYSPRRNEVTISWPSVIWSSANALAVIELYREGAIFAQKIEMAFADTLSEKEPPVPQYALELTHVAKGEKTGVISALCAILGFNKSQAKDMVSDVVNNEVPVVVLRGCKEFVHGKLDKIIELVDDAAKFTVRNDEEPVHSLQIRVVDINSFQAVAEIMCQTLDMSVNRALLKIQQLADTCTPITVFTGIKSAVQARLAKLEQRVDRMAAFQIVEGDRSNETSLQICSISNNDDERTDVAFALRSVLNLTLKDAHAKINELIETEKPVTVFFGSHTTAQTCANQLSQQVDGKAQFQLVGDLVPA